MRALRKDDLYLLSEIIDLMDVDLPKIKSENGLVTKKDQEQYGIELMFSLFKKIYKVKEPLEALIYSLTGEKLEGKSIQEIISLFKQLYEQEGIQNFIKSAGN